MTGKPSEIRNASEFSARRFPALTMQKGHLIFAERVGVTNLAEVSIVSCTLVGVAQPAECLEILGIIGAARCSGQDVIDIERPLVSRNATQLASERCTLQGLVAEPAGDDSQTGSPMLPDRISPPRQELLNCLPAAINETRAFVFGQTPRCRP